jgi:hypothetical protein
MRHVATLALLLVGPRARAQPGVTPAKQPTTRACRGPFVLGGEHDALVADRSCSAVSMAGLSGRLADF